VTGCVAAACGSSGGGGVPTDASAEGAISPDTDGDPADGGVDAPSGADARPEAEAGPPTWCATRSPAPAFCDDFDRGALGAAWDALVQTAGSAVALDPSTFTSAPQSLAVRSKAVGGGEFGNVLLRKTVSSTAPRAKLAFDFQGDPAPTSGGPVAIATLDMSLNHLFTLYLRDEGALDAGASAGPALVELAPVVGQTRYPFTLPALTAGQFVRVEIDVDLGTQRADVRFGGATVLSQIAIAGGATSQPTIRVGVLSTGPQPAYAARFDDVTLELQ
jgi:hypothetical protein